MNNQRIRPYKIDLPEFEGPLDLLLHLIERQELDITAISLANVTEQYLAHLQQLKEKKVEHMIDFLVIAARLVLIKSRALLPANPVVIVGEEEEEDPAEALIRQLRQYKRFKQAASWLQSREEAGLRTYLRLAPPPKVEPKLDLSGVTAVTLRQAVLDALARTSETSENGMKIVEPRRITIEGQLRHVRQQIKLRQQATFAELLSDQRDRVEISITLLAVLELMKRREIKAEQLDMFGPINLQQQEIIHESTTTNT
ncbi:MAG TPA: segregation/condensation protein A [Anaerolineae bacterium]|nr:segregation/condensation protein A [Anaerolineae bacterium]